MGGSTSQPLLEELEGYKIIQKYPENNITHLAHIETDREYLLRELTYNNEEPYIKTLQKHKQRQAITDDHLTHLSRVEGKNIDHLCSNLYKIYAIWEYPYRFLSDEINQRSYQNRKFEDKQVWSILASCILALSTLQKNRIAHEMLTTRTILLDSDGMVKIADPLACGNPSNLDTVHRNRHTDGIYLSPQQCQVLESRGSYNNSYKSDVWIIGMIILECGLLQNMSKCFKDQYQRIDYDMINKKLQQFGRQYGGQLKTIVEQMLKRDSKDRPDWLDLQQYARKLNPNSQQSYSGFSSNKQSSQNQSDQKSNFSSYDKKDQSSFAIQPQPIIKSPHDSYRPSDAPKNTYYQLQHNQAPSNINNNAIPYQPYQPPINSVPIFPQQRPNTYSNININTMHNQVPTAPSNYLFAPVSNNINPSPATAVNFTSNSNGYISGNSNFRPPLPPPTTTTITNQNIYGVPTTSNYVTPVSTNSFPYQPLFRPTQFSSSIGTTSNRNTFTQNAPTAQFGIKPSQPWKPQSSDSPSSYNFLNNPISKPQPYKSEFTSPDFLKSLNTKKDFSPSVTPALNPSYNLANPTNFSSFSSGNNLYSANLPSKPLYNTSTNNQSLFTPPSFIYSTIQQVPVTGNNPVSKKQAIPTTTSIYNPTSTFNNNKFDNLSYTLNNNFSSSTNTYDLKKGFDSGSTSVNDFKQLKNMQPASLNKKQFQQQLDVKVQNNQFMKQVSPEQPRNQNFETIQQHVHTVQSNNQNTYVDQMQQDISEIQHQSSATGNQQHEQPQFVIETFKQGSKYEGFKLREMRHGQGKFYYQDGGMYDGNWSKNKMDGYGSLYYQSGELAYQGMWRQDQFQGKGKLYNQYPYLLEGPFNYENFDEIDEFWSYYQGEFVEDFKKGKGTLMLSNNQYFVGTFNNDMVEGPGQFHCKDGKIIKGVWKQNHLISK